MFGKADQKEQGKTQEKFREGAREGAQEKPVAKSQNHVKRSNLKLKSWYANRYQIAIVQRNILLLFTIVSMIAVTVAVIFVRNIMASKSLEPYVIEVEKKTGIPVVVEQLTARQFTSDQMVRKYFINKFIHAASGYDPKTYKLDANMVRLFSTPNIYSEFRKRINAKELGAEAGITLRIKSVQFPNYNSAQIRLTRQINRNGYETLLKEEIINMDFYFAELDLTLEERLINPLGFQVSKYLVAEEIYNY